jgi:putative PIN family toxin of toxin-antitoxin system
MRLVVLDTNVIVSAGIKPKGLPAQIVQAVIQEAKIQIVVSPSIIGEYRRVSQHSKFAQYGFPPQWLEFLIESALRFQDGEPWPHPVPDPGDACFLSLAHKTGAWLITGNLKHYPVESREGVIVHTPAEYVRILDQHD